MKHGHRFFMVALIAGMLAAALALPAAGGKGALAAQGTIIYVDADATGLNNGGSWRHAFTDLQSALDQAKAGDQIWVAEGTYKPSRRLVPDDPRTATFQMVNGVAIYCGFEPYPGVTKFEDRDWVANETILSGDIGIAGDPSDNVYHVFYHPADLALDSTAILDGSIITEGNVNEPDYPYDLCGGGMLNDHASPTLTNVTFLNNSAVYGGALCVRAPFPEENGGLPLTNVAFVSNSAVEGGSVYIEAAQDDPGDWELTFANCIFRDNVAELGGAVAIALGEPDADMPLIRSVNCTFNNNQAELGGAFHVSKGPGEGWLAVTNSIVWGDIPDEIYLEDGVAPPLVTYSDIQGGFEGVGNINLDPRFVEPDSGDLHLQPVSPCIDVGDNDAPDITTDDFEGDDRILDGDGDGYALVDMGADEYKMPVIPVEISITPYIPTNVIRLRPGVVVDVAILSTDDFDAVAEVAPDMVEFAGATHVGFTFVDVNEDDLVDVLLDFMAEDMVDLNQDSTEATLTGETQDGVPFEGTDEVKVR